MASTRWLRNRTICFKSLCELLALGKIKLYYDRLWDTRIPAPLAELRDTSELGVGGGVF